MKKYFITAILLSLALVNLTSEDQDFLDFVDNWNRASYSEEAIFSDILISIDADYEYDGQDFTYVATIGSKTKEYIQENRDFEKEFIEEFPDIPIPRCFFQENHAIKGVPEYLLDETIRTYYPEFDEDSASYKTIAGQILEYCREYDDPFLILASINYQYYIYYEPVDEFIRIFSP